jgi:glycosyltransferase involved in cell wall biosynthesis
VDIRYVSNSTLASGAANTIHVLRMCEAFAEVGHRPVLYCFAPDEGPMPPDRIARMYALRTSFPIVQRPRPRGVAQRIAYAREALRDGTASRDAHVYTRDLLAAGVARLSGCAFTLESHAAALGPGPLRAGYFRWLIAGPTMRRLVVISKALADWYVEHGVPRDRILVAHDGAPDLAPQGSDERAGAREGARDAFVAGYAGSLNPGKGMELLVPLARRLAHRRDIVLRVVGGEPSQVEHWRERAGGCANLEFVGRVDPARVPEAIRGFDACLLPNQRRMSGHGASSGQATAARDIARFTSPLKLFEYMSASRPIVASDLDVLREVVDESCAMFAAPEDPAEWAARLERLADDPALRVRLGRAARERFERHYSWRERARRVV